MEGIEIERFVDTKFFGAVIDVRLTWKPHIDIKNT